MYKLDLHIHTCYSSDAVTRIEDLIKIAKKRGLSAIAITDHMKIKGALKALAINEDKSLIIIPGIELHTHAGHLLALNIREKPRLYNSLSEVIEEIHNLGGIAVAAHPFDIISPFKNLHRYANILDALEAANAKTLNYQSHINSAFRYLEKYPSLAFTAGSDSHIPETIGDVFLEVEEDIYNPDDVITAILSKRCRVRGSRSPLSARIKKLVKTIFK